jgi:hypothetical protein
MPKKAPMQSTFPDLSTGHSGGNANHNAVKRTAPRIALDESQFRSGTNAGKSSPNGESYETPGAEAIDHRPENPPGSSEEHDFLMSVNCSDTTAYEDKCTMDEPRT